MRVLEASTLHDLSGSDSGAEPVRCSACGQRARAHRKANLDRAAVVQVGHSIPVDVQNTVDVDVQNTVDADVQNTVDVDVKNTADVEVGNTVDVQGRVSIGR